MKAIRIMGLAIVFLVSLLVGQQAGHSVELTEAGSALNPFAMTLMPSPQPVEYANGQRSVLVITTDRLDITRPKLESAWLVMIVPPDPRLTFMPVYPAIAGAETSAQLAGSFSLEQQGDERVLSTDFLQQLRNEEIWWSDTIVFDRAGFEILLAYLDSRGSAFDGNRAAPITAGLLEDLGAAESDNDRLAIQMGLYEDMCWQASLFDVRPGLSSLFGSLDGHYISSARPEQTITALGAVEVSAGGLYCEFPTRRDW